MQFDLRQYQEDCLEHILENQKKEKKLLVQLPTGAGKTVIFWEYLKRNPQKCLIVVPSVQLGEQVWLMGLNFFSEDQISCKFANYRHQIKKFHITTIQSLRSKSSLNEILAEDFKVIIIDEAHKAGARSYFHFLKQFNNDPFLMGFTATPFRNDAINLSTILGPIVYSKNILELIHENYLCDLEGYRIKTEITIKNATYRGGDFTSECLFKLLNTATRNSLILEAFKKHCSDLKTLIFAINIEHCLILERFFLENGIKARAIYGRMPLKTRMDLISSFQSGNIQVLINAQLLTEGFDSPGIEALIIVRPTMSKILYTQMIGRGVRLHKNKKVCKVIELADNYHSLIHFGSLVSEEPTEFTDDPMPNGITITELARLKSTYLTEIKNYSEERINFFDLNSEYLREPAPEYLQKECGYDFLSREESLFLIWKNKKLKELAING